MPARLVRSDPRLEQPDLQINMFGWSAFERLRTGIKPHPFSAFTFSPVHLRPEGRGTVQIKSPDPLAPPAIQLQLPRQRLRFPGADLRHAAVAARSPRSRR